MMKSYRLRDALSICDSLYMAATPIRGHYGQVARVASTRLDMATIEVATLDRATMPGGGARP